MSYKTAEEVIILIKKFEECTLSKSEWTHEAHLTIGLYYCLRFPFGEVLNCLRSRIRWLNELHGIPNNDTSGYHETLTVFWLMTIKKFLKISRHYNIADLANHLIEICGDRQLPLRYYSRELLFSAIARRHHVLPDLDRFSFSLNSGDFTTRTDGAGAMKSF